MSRHAWRCTDLAQVDSLFATSTLICDIHLTGNQEPRTASLETHSRAFIAVSVEQSFQELWFLFLKTGAQSLRAWWRTLSIEHKTYFLCDVRVSYVTSLFNKVFTLTHHARVGPDDNRLSDLNLIALVVTKTRRRMRSP